MSCTDRFLFFVSSEEKQQLSACDWDSDGEEGDSPPGLYSAVYIGTVQYVGMYGANLLTLYRLCLKSYDF